MAGALLELDLPGVTLNVCDGPVRDSLMTLTTLDPPVRGFVSLWTQQHYGEAVRAALEVLAPHADQLAAYLVTESAPLPPPSAPPGQRVPEWDIGVDQLLATLVGQDDVALGILGQDRARLVVELREMSVVEGRRGAQGHQRRLHLSEFLIDGQRKGTGRVVHVLLG